MNATQRRDDMLSHIQQSASPITGAELSALYSVSRQVVVQDIAILRAAGNHILATPNGYLLPHLSVKKRFVRVFTCCHHSDEALREELLLIVTPGGTVVDVVVEHPLYGEFRAMLMLDTIPKVDDFCARLALLSAPPLATLTGGVHIHTVEAQNEAILDGIEQSLRSSGILAE